MTTAVAGPAYAVYNRKPIPEKADALSAWLGVELQTIQRAIPVRFTKTVTAAYTLLTTDDVLLVDATAGPITITWPDPTRAQHFNCTVKKIDASANAVTFASTIASTATAATFDGVTSPTLVSRWDSREYRSNGVQYYQKVAGVVAIFTASVPAANVTSGTFGSASGDAGTYAFSHAVTVAGTLGVGGLISSTVASGNFFAANSGTTGGLNFQMKNTSGFGILGVESSVAGTSVPGSHAYATFLFTNTSTDLQFGTNSAINMTIAAGGAVTIGSTINGQTISSAANFTGSATIAGNLFVSTILQNGATDLTINTSVGTQLANWNHTTGKLTQNFDMAVTGAFSSGALTATTGTFSGDIAMTNNFITINNGAYFRAKRNSGSAAINVLGMLAGTDDLAMITSGVFRLRNTGNVDLFTVDPTGPAIAVLGTLAVTAAVAFSKEARLQNTTVAGLTAAATAGAGATAYVTDSTLGLGAGLGLAVIGGGANGVPCYSDGAAWRIG